MSKEYTRLVSILGQLPFADRIILLDDFEGSLKWHKYQGDGDAIFELDPTLSKHGNQSIFMQTRTTSHVEDDVVGMTKYLHLLPTKILTLLTSFYIPHGDETKFIEFVFNWYDGTLIHTASIGYILATHYWQYYTDGEAYANIPASNVPMNDITWHLLKLAINLNANKYISLQIDHRIYDLSTLSSFSDTNPSGSHLRATISAHASAAAVGSLNIDDLAIYEI